MKSTPIKAVLALCITGVLGGIAPVFMKIALKEFTPVQIVFHRFFIALIFLFPIAITSGRLKFHKHDLPLLLFASLLFSGNIFLFVFGLQYTTSIASQLMYLLTPTLVIVLSALIFRSPVRSKHIISIVAGIIGGIILISRNSGSDVIRSLGTVHGNLIVLCAVFSWSSYVIVTKKLSAKYDPLSMIVLNNTVITVISLAILLLLRIDIVGAYSGLSAMGLGSLMSLAFLNSILFFFLLQWGIKLASPFAVSVSAYLSPLATAIAAVPLFGEQITLQLALSAGLIILSSYLTFRKSK